MVLKMETGQNGGTKLPAVENFWLGLENSYNNWRKKENGNTLSFHPERKKDFSKLFSRYYNVIKNQFMTPETEGLDVHKQSAIMVISALEANIIEQTQEEGKVALGAQAVILDVAFSYLEQSINNKLKEIGAHTVKLKLPVALACDTSYFNILRRILYYEDNRVEIDDDFYKMSYNVIEWSDRFFLLEYITLLSNGIDPQLVKDRFRKLVES